MHSAVYYKCQLNGYGLKANLKNEIQVVRAIGRSRVRVSPTALSGTASGKHFIYAHDHSPIRAGVFNL